VDVGNGLVDTENCTCRSVDYMEDISVFVYAYNYAQTNDQLVG
jgi:hypothetical protein